MKTLQELKLDVPDWPGINKNQSILTIHGSDSVQYMTEIETFYNGDILRDGCFTNESLEISSENALKWIKEKIKKMK